MEMIRRNRYMNSVHFHIPWKLYLGSTLWIMIAAQVSCWSLPRESMHVELPTDFPADVPFYRVTSLQDVADSLDSVVHYRMRERKASRHSRLLKINHLTGTLSVNESTDIRERQGRQRRTVSAVVLVSLNNTSASDNQNQKTHLNISFSGNVTFFCQPSANLCFPGQQSRYRISEGIRTHVVFDTLHYIGTSLCKNVTANYRVTKGQELVAVSPNKGDLSLISALDAETMKSLQFEVECLINRVHQEDDSSPRYTMTGDIRVLDINDNAPTTQSGKKHVFQEYRLKPFQDTLSFGVTAIDKDSEKVNDFRVKIKDDDLGLFSVGKKIIFGNVSDEIGTFFNVNISSQTALAFPGPEYNFSVIIEDAAFLSGENQVIYDIKVHNTSYPQIRGKNVQFQEVYNVTLSRKSAEYTKVLVLGDIEDADHCIFWLENKEPEDKWFGITEYSGIFFIRDPQSVASTMFSDLQIHIYWSCGDKTGNVTIIVRLAGTDVPFRKCENWCALYSEEHTCNEGCGKGSLNGHCHWRKGSEETSMATSNYSTCSPDLSFCPDGKCDNLEKKDASICPQDCAVRFTGEVVPNPDGKGLRQAVGPCTCFSPSECVCARSYAANNETINARFSDMKPETSNKFSTSWPESENEDVTVIAYSDGSYIARDIAAIAGIASTTTCGRSCVAFIFLGICCFVVTCVVLILICKMKLGKKKKHKYVGSHISLSAVPSDYIDERSSSVQDSRQLSESSSSGKQQTETKWEFPRESLILQETLGEGEFGRVLKAQAWNIDGHQGYTTVAVKMLKDNSSPCEQQDLISEFHLLKEVSHPNVIRLLAACTEKSAPLYIIVEFAEYGSLRSYLRKKRHLCDSSHPCTCLVPTDCFHNPTYIQPRGARPCLRISSQKRELMSFAWQIARGMAYLSDMKLVHRDLAARNVLLATGKVAKISDFGLTRDVYEGDTYLKKSKGRVPVKWMAIESLEDNLYTTRSDVWSYGIVLWEIMTQGATPYPGIMAEQLYHLLKAGYRMERPERCPEDLYNIMQLCWRDRPCDRPSFKELVQKLDVLLQDTVEYLDLQTQFSSEEPADLPDNSSGCQMNTLRDANGQTSSEIQYAKIYHEEDKESSLSSIPSSMRHLGPENVLRPFGDDESKS